MESALFSEELMGKGLPLAEVTKRNKELQEMREQGKSEEEFREKVLNGIKGDEIAAVKVNFVDLEGRHHSLEYRKEFFADGNDNLTFDGSSINGFTTLGSSDLRLGVDWSSTRYAPTEIYGPGKIIVFGKILKADGKPYEGDMRGRLASLCEETRKEGKRVLVAPEIEGFLFEGTNAEQRFDEKEGFPLDRTTSYFTSLPQDGLRVFIDTFARVLWAMGFQNEKDHPEVAPGQFEVNFKYAEAIHAADQVILYKEIARQVAKRMGKTVSFLPKPIADLNGNGMHTNMSITDGEGNLFYGADDPDKLSEMGRLFAGGILERGLDVCLALNASVNAFRRLDPKFEAPNEIKMDARDRGSMVRIPLGNEKSARIEVRTVAPDANVYMAWLLLCLAGQEGIKERKKFKNPETPEKLPADIQTAIDHFRKSTFIIESLGEGPATKYADLKEAAANRVPRDLGTSVKAGEVLFHHDVTNQALWADY